jgi:hypothetical protein
MSFPRHSRKTAAGLLLLVMLAAAGAFAVQTRTGSTQSPPPSQLRTVSSQLLDASHISLSAPTDQEKAHYAAGQAAAEERALKFWPGARLVEAALLKVDDSGVRCLCWVVVVDSPQPMYEGQPFNPDPNAPGKRFVPESKFRLALVDATTGQFMYGVEGAHGAWVTGPRTSP